MENENTFQVDLVSARAKAEAVGIPTPPADAAREPRVADLLSKKFHKRRRRLQAEVFSMFQISAAINGLALAIVCAYIIYYGVPAISWEFLTSDPLETGQTYGILPCIIGTILLSYGALIVALPWGVGTAIYLHEYARPGPVVNLIRLAIHNLAGVPSVVFGLFGLAVFVNVMHFGKSVLAGVLTLAAFILPLVIGAAEEALRSVPQSYREASLGLGGTKWQTIWRVVLPPAAPGILTGAILGVGRASGETAAIMFTAAVTFSTSDKFPGLFDPVMALPYHVYKLAKEGRMETLPVQYGTSLTLIVLVLGMNLLAIIIRAKLRKPLR